MRYLIKFGYDGTKFHGFQRQNDVKNVQGTLENALSKVLKSNILIKGSGRTDAGVHAHMQCAHFDYDGSVSNKDIDKINILLNNEIIINKISVVSNDFHARHNVIKKMYVYKVNNGKYKKEYDGYYYQVKYDFDIKKHLIIINNEYDTFDEQGHIVHHVFRCEVPPELLSLLGKSYKDTFDKCKDETLSNQFESRYSSTYRMLQNKYNWENKSRYRADTQEVM